MNGSPGTVADLAQRERGIEAIPDGISSGDLAEVLFCSSLQPSDRIDAGVVHAALGRSLRSHHGEVRECAEELADSYGKDPEFACPRMRWARATIAETFPGA